MSLPSIHILKDQANRLVSYLGDKHRIRLKASSALEAIAAMYKQRDWNTLQALARRADAGPEDYASAASNPTPGYLTPKGQYPLTWLNGRIGYAVGENDWFRHTLVCGGAREDRQTWLQQQLMAHLDRSGAGAFINPFGGDLTLELSQALRAGLSDRLVLLDLARPAENTVSLNLLAGLEPEDVAALLLRLLPTVESSPGADFYRQKANHALTVLAAVLQHVGERVTLAAMLRPWRDNGTELLNLLTRAAPESQAYQNLRTLLDSLRHRDEDKLDVASLLGGLVGRLSLLAAEPWAAVLFSADASALSLGNLLQQGRCLVIEGAGQGTPAAGKAEKLLGYALRAACQVRLYGSTEERANGWVFGFGEISDYLTPAFAPMLAGARASRIALLMTAADRQIVARHPTGKAILANVWNQLFLGGLDEAKAQEIVEELRTAPVALCQPGSVQWAAQLRK